MLTVNRHFLLFFLYPSMFLQRKGCHVLKLRYRIFSLFIHCAAHIQRAPEPEADIFFFFVETAAMPKPTLSLKGCRGGKVPNPHTIGVMLKGSAQKEDLVIQEVWQCNFQEAQFRVEVNNVLVSYRHFGKHSMRAVCLERS